MSIHVRAATVRRGLEWSATPDEPPPSSFIVYGTLGNAGPFPNDLKQIILRKINNKELCAIPKGSYIFPTCDSRYGGFGNDFFSFQLVDDNKVDINHTPLIRHTIKRVTDFRPFTYEGVTYAIYKIVTEATLPSDLDLYDRWFTGQQVVEAGGASEVLAYHRNNPKNRWLGKQLEKNEIVTAKTTTELIKTAYPNYSSNDARSKRPHLEKHDVSVEAVEKTEGGTFARAHTVVVLLVGNEVAGFCTLQEKIQNSLKMLYIDALCSVSGNGNGNRLLQFVEALARQNEFELLQLTSLPYSSNTKQECSTGSKNLPHFYQKNGFQFKHNACDSNNEDTLDEAKHDPDLKHKDGIVMSKCLRV
jgi:hypothetical protein